MSGSKQVTSFHTERIEALPGEANVLLVDDKPERLLSYEVALGSLGHNLVRAQSGAEALGLLMKMEFAAILLDVSMPEMDGFETAALIRDHPRFEETPIIFVTGVQVTDLDQRKGYEMGAVDYVQIPVVPAILRGKVQALVQLYLQRAELSRLNKALEVTNTQLAKAHEDLKAENMRELQQLNQTLERANNELVETNNQLTQEIAEREKAEQALYQASQRKDEYIAVLAHELRNPLSAIHNAVEVMQLPSASEEQLGWAKDLLQRQVIHLTCLMDDLLDVSRITSGRIQLRLEPIALAEVIQHAADTLAPMLKKYDHRLEIDLPEEPLFVNGDMVRLTQVLDNLLTNAAKYMNDGGIISLCVERDDEWVMVRVRDQGIGITEDLLGEVFELFVQAPTAINRAQGGLGIGLALVRGLVELHGGDTFVASEGAGRGSEFSVRLPLISAGTVAVQVKKPVVSVNPQSLRVLVVDDNTDSARALAICLESQGYQIRVKHTGEDGFNEALSYQPHFVLLDIGLPDIDGYEVASRLRDSNDVTPLAVIAMTGYGGDKDRAKAESAGFNRFLVKPVDLSQLFNALNEESEKLM